MRYAAQSAPERTILVVDDDPKTVALVRMYLEREGFGVITADDGSDALRLARERGPDLIVLDLMLPGIDGLTLARVLRRESDVPVLMLSARGGVADRVAGMSEGADDYVAKPFSPAELVVRVKAILRRTSIDRSPPEAATLRHGDLVIDRERREVRRGSEAIPLSYVEFNLLAALVAAEGRVLTRDSLLEVLYGDDSTELIDRTIDVYVRRLREKLGDDAEQPRYVATVRGVGYRAALHA